MKAKITIYDDDGNEVDHFLNKPTKIYVEEKTINGHTQTLHRYRFSIDYVEIDGWKGGMFLKGDTKENVTSMTRKDIMDIQFQIDIAKKGLYS